MPLVSFQVLMADAERGGYAVGYFESWNLESLLAVCDAAKAQRSPVILGFSGIYLPHPRRCVQDPLEVVAAMAAAAGRRLTVPCCLLFNESPHLDKVQAAIAHGFQLVMYTPEGLSPDEQIHRVRSVVEQAHAQGVAVEGEIAPLQGVAGDLKEAGQSATQRIQPDTECSLTDPTAAHDFVSRTGIDALGVNIGQIHLHGRRAVRLNLDRLRELRKAVQCPLVLHGASSVQRDDLQAAVKLGIRKVNFGSVLKQAFVKALSAACAARRDDDNPYEVIGSGLEQDVLVAGRLAMQAVVAELMRCLGSVGKGTTER